MLHQDPNSSTNSRDRFEGYDQQQVEEYLKVHPEPSLDTMRSFTSEKITPQHWESFLKTDWEYILKIFKLAGNANIDGLPQVALKDLTEEWYGEAIELETCSVSAISINKLDRKNIRYKCNTCEQNWVLPNELSMSASTRPKMQCGCSEPLITQINDRRDLISVQWIRVSEIKKDSKLSKTPVTIPCILKGKELLWSVKFGEHIKPRGLMRLRSFRGRDGRMDQQTCFEIFAFKRVKQDEQKDVVLAEQDIQYIQSEMEQPQFFEKLLASFAPHIYGMEILKQAALLTLASVGMQKPARILIVGDPSVGKSDIMSYAAAMLPGSYYVVMSRTTKTGLTATSQKELDTDAWTVEPGVFALADGSALFVDEFQQGKAEDITALNDIVERGKLIYALAGGNIGEYDANCAVMISSNAHGGMIGSEENIHELLKFVGKGLPAFLSRMNLVIFLKQNKTKEEHMAIADKIWDHSEVDPLEYYKEDWNRDGVDYYGTTNIRKIIKYIIERVPVPPLPRESELKQHFQQYYVNNALDVTAQVNKLISPRFMRHSVILAQIFARIHGRSQPIEADMLHIFDLLEKHMSTAAFDPKTGEIDVNQLNGNQSQRAIDDMNKADQFEQAIQMAMKDREYFTQDDLELELNMIANSKWKKGVAGLDTTAIEKELEKRCRFGKLYEKHGQGKYTPV